MIAITLIMLTLVAYSIGHYHGAQSCSEDIRLVSEALKYMRVGDDDDKKKSL